MKLKIPSLCERGISRILLVLLHSYLFPAVSFPSIGIYGGIFVKRVHNHTVNSVIPSCHGFLGHKGESLRYMRLAQYTVGFTACEGTESWCIMFLEK